VVGFGVGFGIKFGMGMAFGIGMGMRRWDGWDEDLIKAP